MRGLALGGFMGTGKSTVGRLVAARVGVPFVDVDAVLVERHGPIADQFATVGEPGFRERERAILVELCDGITRVIATGGGAWVQVGMPSRLAQHYERAVLHADLATLQRRIPEQGERPLWGRASRLWAERQEAYAVADAAFRTDDVRAEVVADRVEAWWCSR